MGIRRSERGAGKLKAIIVTAILIVGIIAACKLIPPYSAEYQLADKMQEIARFAVVNRYTEEQIREQVFKTIQDLEIPAKREDIKVIAHGIEGEDFGGLHRSGRSSRLPRGSALHAIERKQVADVNKCGQAPFALAGNCCFPCIRQYETLLKT